MGTAAGTNGAGGERLPFVDEHRVVIRAAAADVWDVLAVVAAGMGTGVVTARYAGLVGAEPRRRAGRFPDPGASVPGFEVAQAVPEKLLRLAGRHRFARYELTFRLAEGENPGETVLRAETRADFPGVAGTAYRTLVIGSGGHRVAVPRLLRVVRARAERRAAGTGSGPAGSGPTGSGPA